MLKIRPSGLLPSGSWLEGLFCVWAIYALRLSKRKKAPPANYPKVEGQRGSEVKINRRWLQFLGGFALRWPYVALKSKIALKERGAAHARSAAIQRARAFICGLNVFLNWRCIYRLKGDEWVDRLKDEENKIKEWMIFAELVYVKTVWRKSKKWRNFW